METTDVFEDVTTAQLLLWSERYFETTMHGLNLSEHPMIGSKRCIEFKCEWASPGQKKKQTQALAQHLLAASRDKTIIASLTCSSLQAKFCNLWAKHSNPVNYSDEM